MNTQYIVNMNLTSKLTIIILFLSLTCVPIAADSPRIPDKNLEIARIGTPEEVRKGQQFEVTLTILNKGNRSHPFHVTINHTGNYSDKWSNLMRSSVNTISPESSQNVTLYAEIMETGKQRITATIFYGNRSKGPTYRRLPTEEKNISIRVTRKFVDLKGIETYFSRDVVTPGHWVKLKINTTNDKSLDIREEGRMLVYRNGNLVANSTGFSTGPKAFGVPNTGTKNMRFGKYKVVTKLKKYNGEVVKDQATIVYRKESGILAFFTDFLTNIQKTLKQAY